MGQIFDAASGLKEMAERQEWVERAEERVKELLGELGKAEEMLDSARRRFDDARKQTLEHCPALADGYGATKVTETVAIVDGNITVVPITQVA